MSTIDRPISNEEVVGRDFFAFTWPASDQARVWHLNDLLAETEENRRTNPALIQVQIIPDIPTSSIYLNMLGDIWFDLVVRLSGPPLWAAIEFENMLPRYKPATIDKGMLAPPIPPGLVVDFPMDEVDALLAEECVYADLAVASPDESN